MRARGTATGTNRIMLDPWDEALGRGRDRGRSDEEMADTWVEEAGEEDITVGESATATMMATVTIPATNIEPEVARVLMQPPMVRAIQHNCGRSYR